MKLPNTSSTCPQCGHPLAPNAKICFHCGYDRGQALKDAESMGPIGTIIAIIGGIIAAIIICSN